MPLRPEQFRLTLCSAVLLAIAGCGGGGGAGVADSAVVPTTLPSTTNVSTTVVDGALNNALVCMDTNGNGKCDADEVQGRTDVAGKVTLAVPNADVNKYPIIAVVGTDAVDADHGPVTVAYTMSTPADQPGVVSPLTTLVQQTVASNGFSTADAAKAVQDATSINTSLFQDFTKVTAPTDGSISAATVARMLVVTTQQQSSAIKDTVGTSAMDGKTITREDLDKAIQKKLLELLPSILSKLSDPTVREAITPADKETALLAAATALVTASGLTPDALPTLVAVNTQIATAPTATPEPAPVALVSLAALTFTDASNFYARHFTRSIAQSTLDVNKTYRFVDRRMQNIAGNLAKWGSGGSPARNSDLHWNGAAWVNCPINFESVATVDDALGNGGSDYCDKLSVDTRTRASFSIADKTMAEVYAQARAAGYTNLSIADPVTALGSAVFPAGSLITYHRNTPVATAISYYPAGTLSPAGISNVASQYSAEVAAGGVASTQAAGIGCNAPDTSTNGSLATTLEGWIATKTGTPCVYMQGSITLGGVTYPSELANEWWGNSTAGIDRVGASSVPGFYTGRSWLRISFTGSGTNPVTYYACKERYSDGSARNCSAIGTGSYTITTLGDARVLSLNNPPAQFAALSYDKVWVERGGFVYAGYQSKKTPNNSARLNTAAATALLTQLGMPVEDPSVPLALTLASYAGIWDGHDTSKTAGTNTVRMTVSRDGSCGTDCLLELNPLTGAYTMTTSLTTCLVTACTYSGTLNFLTGTGTGVYAASPLNPEVLARR